MLTGRNWPISAWRERQKSTRGNLSMWAATHISAIKDLSARDARGKATPEDLSGRCKTWVTFNAQNPSRSFRGCVLDWLRELSSAPDYMRLFGLPPAKDTARVMGLDRALSH